MTDKQSTPVQPSSKAFLAEYLAIGSDGAGVGWSAGSRGCFPACLAESRRGLDCLHDLAGAGVPHACLQTQHRSRHIQPMFSPLCFFPHIICNCSANLLQAEFQWGAGVSHACLQKASLSAPIVFVSQQTASCVATVLKLRRSPDQDSPPPPLPHTNHLRMFCIPSAV